LSPRDQHHPTLKELLDRMGGTIALQSAVDTR
jgi:hypothetical protein